MAKKTYLEYTFFIRAKVTVTVPKMAYQEHDEANEESHRASPKRDCAGRCHYSG